MKVLNLIIKQKYFDEILNGTKTEEYREVRPTTFKKYLKYVVNDKEYDSLDHPEVKALGEDVEFDVAVIPYDAIRLYVGYNKNRDSMLVEVKDAFITFFTDENDEDITYEYNGDTYVVSEMTYVLGDILEKDIHPKSNQKNF